MPVDGCRGGFSDCSSIFTGLILMLSRFAWVVIVAAEVTAIAALFDFKIDPSYLQHLNYPLGYTISWVSTEKISPAVFVALWLFFILLVNLLRVRWYGEIEYWIGVTKMIFFVGLILFNVINNARTKTFFRYYQEPYGFESNGFNSSRGEFHGGESAHFAAMGTAMIVTIFSMIGFETVAITAPENKDLETEESIKLATRKISLRIILLYTLGVFVVGLNVPDDDPQLIDTSVNALNNGAHSIFVIAAVRDGVRGFPSFFNGFFIFSATSAGMNALYISSRLLHALANVPAVWPSWPIAQSIRHRLERTTDSGVPAAAVLTSWVFGWLGMLATRTNTSQVRYLLKPRPEKISRADSCLFLDFGKNGHEFHSLHPHRLYCHLCSLPALLPVVSKLHISVSSS